ncbi:hypothetical protein [Denitratisoma oestradiolicum]|uniref:Phosphoglycerate mutase n=1 Tax=Denitratisoma oestradiolicum TaxID=311182 RepID=A0A6S6Y2G0_9PROT|nr:hypothetical protein [Denitratisoma oestradiolicum]TWO80299.1 hypothetical protein CBW56_10845 [Denitratisoma oestradiolicum]CAB1369396.1 conserved protein of unknown function [Denitratisoma oestradiolicum]
MRITFVIPGLLWPRQALLDTLTDLPLPALESLLGRARHGTPPPSPQHYWQSAFSLDRWAAAPLRRLGLGLEDDGRTWLCADPVHLQLGRQSALLGDPADLALEFEEARQLHASLAPLFDSMGELCFDGPNTWHLALSAPPPQVPEQLPVGASAVALLPEGPTARPWRRLLNEVQMSLHGHQVNQLRTAAGKPTIDSLALWGAGSRPQARRRPFNHLWSDDPLIWGLGHLGNIATRNLPASFETARRAVCIHYDGLIGPSRLHDAMAWREALARLESQWLAPALHHRAVDSIELLAWGEAGAIQLTLDAWQRRKFWRHPLPLAELVIPQADEPQRS